MSIDRQRFQQVGALRRVHDSAVRLGKTPGQAGIGVASAAAPSINTLPVTESSADAAGNTIEAAGLWDNDLWDRFYWI